VLRILNVRSDMHPIWGGGSTERALQMSRALALQPGVEVTLLSLDLGATPDWPHTLPGVDVVALSCANKRFQVPAASSRSIEKPVRRADVIHMMGHWSMLNALVYRRAVSVGVPYVVCPAGALPIFGRSKYLKRAYNRFVGQAIIRDAAGRIAITRDEVPQFLAYGVSADSVRVIPNGVVPSEYEYRDDDAFRTLYELGDAPFLLFVGRLNPIKGPDLLIESFASIKERFPQHLLVMAGQDEGMLRQLTTLTEKHALRQRVRFIGHVSGEMKSAAYHAAELLVIPSRQEAMSIVVLESGAAGTPVVATDQCGLKEIAQIDGGIIVPATVHGLAGGIAAALDDPSKLPAMGEKLRAYTVKNFSWSVISSRLVTLFEEAIAESGAGSKP